MPDPITRRLLLLVSGFWILASLAPTPAQGKMMADTCAAETHITQGLTPNASNA